MLLFDVKAGLAERELGLAHGPAVGLEGADGLLVHVLAEGQVHLLARGQHAVQVVVPRPRARVVVCSIQNIEWVWAGRRSIKKVSIQGGFWLVHNTHRSWAWAAPRPS